MLLTYCLPAQEFINIEHGCNYDEEETEKEYVLLDASSEAQRIVMEILEANSMFFMSFILKEANVKNAQATFANKNKYILYSPVFLENFKKEAKTRWAAYSMLAHEIGHHIYGHDFTETNSQKRKTLEIQADNFSGSILRKLGATFDQAQAGINTFALEGETSTHPSKSMRSTAIANGWKRQDDLLKGVGAIKAPPPVATSTYSKEEVQREMAKAKQYYDNKDYTKAFPIYYKYRNSPYFSSNYQSNLGYMYDEGKGVQQDDYEAVKWYRKAAEQGGVHGQLILGIKYELGKGVQQDDYEAVKWYRKSAEQGDADGQRILGYKYELGKGVQQDYYEAVKWYRKSAEQGNAYGQRSLGDMYRDGLGVSKDDYEAVKWYRKAAEQGDADGQLKLGTMYDKGRGVQQDDYEAVKWYRKAAEQGDALGQCSLGYMYREGNGVQQDDYEAVKWYRKSAEQGNALGQAFLAQMYESGRGVNKDIAAAVILYRQAASQGSPYAKDALKRLGYD